MDTVRSVASADLAGRSMQIDIHDMPAASVLMGVP